ncbi:hypothetical protein DMB66_17445 [Actinoplanes sp. ATCC 53533]|uniref:hypothetical protein n=1 Tax=Actinoplanes sp. ATCC 53533 TaxID=1288362 RepID=UPI000F787DAE|nr:hypothetical protein [Actinoplanes sp. ATCC 53533]RSM65190.1 hypothetical protein DMB66_17445 [Actinoplanes sp. ATCC 53533]
MRDEIEQVYRAYAPVPLDPDVAYCDHCVSAEQIAELHSYPLREIPAEAIGKLVFKGLSTWGEEPYFRHFIPRLLELTVAGELNDLPLTVYLPSKLARCLASGTPEERAAVDRFLTAWWLDTLARHPSPLDAETVYEMVTALGRPGEPLLAAFPGAKPWHLTMFVVEAAYRDPPPDVAAWLRSGVPAALLTAAGNTTDDLELLEQIGWALELLARNY